MVFQFRGGQMPKANPIAKIMKQVSSIQIKADKLVSEMAELSALVANLQSSESAPEKVDLQKTTKKRLSAKVKESVTSDASPKKRGRPRKNP